MYRGTNPQGLGQSYDDLVERLGTEYTAFQKPQTVAKNGASPVASTLDKISFDFEGVDEIEREFTVSFKWTLNSAKNQPPVYKIEDIDYFAFQKKQQGTKSTSKIQQPRGGQLDAIIFKEITLMDVHTNYGKPLALNASGLRGRVYALGSGQRCLWTIPPHCQAVNINRTVHKLPPNQLTMADLKYTKMNKDYLESMLIDLSSRVPGMWGVPVQSPYTEVIAQQKSKKIPTLDKIAVFCQDTLYVVPRVVIDACQELLMEKRGENELPTSDLYQFEMSINHIDGTSWDDTTVASSACDETGLIGKELVDKEYWAMVTFKANLVHASGEEWDRNVQEKMDTLKYAATTTQ